MRTTLLVTLAAGTIGLISMSATRPTPAVAAPPADVPAATQPSDLSLAASLIDDFVAGRDEPLMERASKSLKNSLKGLTLGTVRDDTIGAGAAAAGPDKVIVTCARRVVGKNGRTYEITTTMENGVLQVFFVRLVK